MGKVAVIALVAFSISGAYYTLDRNQRTLDTEARISDHQYEVLAREAALTGFSLARQRLADSYTSFEASGESQSGEYDVSITVSGDLAKVTSVGTVMGTDGLPLSYTILAEFDGATGVQYQPEAPEFLQYALISEQSINLGGSVSSHVYLEGEEGSELNANIHTNADLSINGNRVRVEGYGTFYGTVSASPARAVDTSFDPNYEPIEGPSVYQVDEKVEMPNYDATAYVNQVLANGFNVIEHSGDFSLSGTYDYGPRDNPTIIHITGDLVTAGSSQINGYVMYMVDGNVSLNGNLEAGNTGYGGPDESSVAIYAGGTVGIEGTVEIAAQIYSDGGLDVGVDLGGNATIYGGLSTFGEASIQGTPQIYYRTPSAALAINWQEVETTATHLASYSEW